MEMFSLQASPYYQVETINWKLDFVFWTKSISYNKKRTLPDIEDFRGTQWKNKNGSYNQKIYEIQLFGENIKSSLQGYTAALPG